MEIAASSALRKPTLPMRPLRRGVLIGLGVAGVICALAATWWASVGWLARQQPVDPHDIPSWLIIISLTAILAAALALPNPVRRAMVLAIREDFQMRLLCAALLALPALMAVGHWRRGAFSPPGFAVSKAQTSLGPPLS